MSPISYLLVVERQGAFAARVSGCALQAFMGPPLIHLLTRSLVEERFLRSALACKHRSTSDVPSTWRGWSVQVLRGEVLPSETHSKRALVQTRELTGQRVLNALQPRRGGRPVYLKVMESIRTGRDMLNS